MRIMGLDYGDKTVGVAISDEMLLTAQPVETIKRERANKLRQTYARIEELIMELKWYSRMKGLQLLRLMLYLKRAVYAGRSARHT